jgi:hypothetical protein
MIRRILVALSAAALAVTVFAAPANAGVITCTWSSIAWVNGGSNWGAGKFCGNSSNFLIQTDDTRSDGYCVHGEAYDLTSGWTFVPNSESCGPVRTQTPVYSGPVTDVRVVRGDPLGCASGSGNCNGVGVNYFTLRHFASLATNAVPAKLTAYETAPTAPDTVDSTACLSGHLCVYTDANYGGLFQQWQNPAPGSCITLTGSFNNTISSLQNNLSRTVTAKLGGCTDSTHWTFNAGQHASNLNAPPFWPYWNDSISSIVINSQ